MSQHSKNKHERKKVYVDRKVQGGVVLRLAGIWIATTALASVVSIMLGYFSNPVMGFDYYLQQSLRTSGPLLLAFAAVLPLAALHLVRFTHRCVGPIVRLRRALRELASGESSEPVRFRKSDYWHDLASEFNEVSRVLTAARAEIDNLKSQVAQLENRNSEIDYETDPTTPAPALVS